ncbi:pyridoxamine 5'-phosphate oxidase family protein [Allorhizocola rhizosphaerae]|uniref:pyridoxamine 5'-phosphate oxidase family protein n=1 Tax=Allorhizocola rhizosphaerae TaxID=1872709 RepID=UPI000E3CB436|nr:pyridoxamine 5'-phosphate oxidase family protein [Allorhizocola rhizosphaerae]
MNPPPRTLQQRKQDTLHRLEHDVDGWIATASPDGTPYLMPLSFLWDGSTLLLSTAVKNPTARNLRSSGLVRIGIGLVRDVVLIEGTVQTIERHEMPTELGDAFAAKAGFDPRQAKGDYPYFRVRPRLIQAWREVNELKDRDLMRDGRWL